MNVDSICFAYLDANTGTMLLQIVLGGLGGLLVVSRLFWHRIRGFFSLRRRDSNTQDVAEATDQTETPQQTSEQAHKRAA